MIDGHEQGCDCLRCLGDEFSGELPGVTIARPPPLKEANPLRK